MKPSRVLAVNVGKGARWLSRQMGKGGGTALPGLLALTIDPTVLSSLARDVADGCVLITGTNGKTTTTRIVLEAFRRAGLLTISNQEGSNLLRGLATVLLSHADGWGSLRASRNTIAVFEVDEGTLLSAVQAVQPCVVALTNLFRDQLDRYFEVEYVGHLWGKALRQLPPTASVVLNADDPQVAYLGEGISNPVIYYGLECKEQARLGLEHAADARRCLRCDSNLQYALTFYAHLGHYRCSRCGWRRPQPHFFASEVELTALRGSRIRLETPLGREEFSIPLPGLYNVYNVVAAIAATHAGGVAVSIAAEAAANTRPAFGRLERFEVDGKSVCIILVKNPSGLNQVLRLLAGDESVAGLVLALNDRIADGRDVSWIWDADMEEWKGRLRFVIAAGDRAFDMAVRLKYAGLVDGIGRPNDPGRAELVVVPDVYAALKEGLARTGPGSTLYVLPTYTAMLDLQRALARAGILQPYWSR